MVYPGGPAKAPLLLVQTASLHSGDGDQAIYTQLLAYRAGADKFAPVYAHETGRNNNQEVPLSPRGPLIRRGDRRRTDPGSALRLLDHGEPAWAGLHHLAEVLRYRSATGYGDGNQLAVIDSRRWPGIENRLGLWRKAEAAAAPRCPQPLSEAAAQENGAVVRKSSRQFLRLQVGYAGRFDLGRGDCNGAAGRCGPAG